MCGICGMVSGSRGPDIAIVERMIARMEHRGPDGAGIFRDNRVALGHVRLAIIDAEGGVQPLANEDGSIWITFNGEIFNYIEIARTLRDAGHVIKTASDTEVIVHAWEEWGEGCFERFNGQWAIALWNRKTNELILSRDRMGVRPLYYARTGQDFLFSSEIKGLFADPGIPRALDPEGLAESFTFWSTVAPRTPFWGVYELEPGCWATYRDGELTIKPYWSIHFPSRLQDNPRSLEESCAQLREKLREATRLRFLRSDVPVGAYLSGGIDSALTAAIVNECSSSRLKTFSLRFDDPEYDEGTYQSEMVRRLGTDHEEIHVGAAEIQNAFPDVIWHAEKPILRAAPVPLYLLSRLVHESGYKVVVTGEGADEVLAGYDIFRESKVRAFLARDPESAKRNRAYELLYPWMQRSPAKMPSMARVFFAAGQDRDDPAFSHRPRWKTTREILGMLGPRMRAAASCPVEEKLVATMPEESVDWEPLAKAQWLEMKTLLPGYILSSQGDRMLMANSVEGRFPFLDPEVVKLAHGMPALHKLFALDEKHVLKRAFEGYLPASILERSKQPYRAPDAASFFGESRPEWMDDLVSQTELSRAGIFDPGIVAAFMTKCERVGGRGMSNTDNMRLLAILSTMLLDQIFIQGNGSGGRVERPSVKIVMMNPECKGTVS